MLDIDKDKANNPTYVAEYYHSLINNRGYDIDFRLSDLCSIDRYCENVLWSMDYSSESFFQERSGFASYIGELLVRSSGAQWVGDFDFYEYLGNYYTSFVAFPNGFKVAPERIISSRISNKYDGLSITESMNMVLKKASS